MRRLLIAVVVLVLLGAGADFAAARIFEDRVTDALQREYDLGRRPVVQVRDFPFLPHLATGRFSTIDVAATDATARGINAAQLKLTLHGVRVPREVLLGEPGRVTVDRADGTSGLTEAEVNRLLGDRLRGGELAIGEDEVEVRTQVPVPLLGQPLDVLVSGRLGARDGDVTFTPGEIRLGERGALDPAAEDLLSSQLTFQVPLPELPAGVRLERVETRPGTLVLSGRAASVGVAA
jgi:LmeA-like phospholipid-binding